jgi:hypothetical protein
MNLINAIRQSACGPGCVKTLEIYKKLGNYGYQNALAKMKSTFIRHLRGQIVNPKIEDEFLHSLDPMQTVK